MGIGAAVVRTDWLALDSMWVVPLPCGDGCSDVEVGREMDVASGACSSGDRWWRRGRWCYNRDCVDRDIQGSGPAASLIQHVGCLDPVS
jgi:hypothetical protein